MYVKYIVVSCSHWDISSTNSGEEEEEEKEEVIGDLQGLFVTTHQHLTHTGKVTFSFVESE